MKNLNKYWLLLIFLGVFSLVVVVGWDIYQITSGNRSTTEYTVIELESEVLMPTMLYNHLVADEDYAPNY